MVTRHNLNLYRLPNEESDTEQRGPRTPSPLPSENDNQHNEQQNHNEDNLQAPQGNDTDNTTEKAEQQIKEEVMEA